ncbi:hypothetical protein ACS0TY_022526 [Phlomoides rotata]
MIRNRFSEMNAPRDSSSVNKYYNLAHAVNERVIRQPSMCSVNEKMPGYQDHKKGGAMKTMLSKLNMKDIAYVQLGLGLGGGTELYPERPDEPDCIYYLRTGLWGYDNRCYFNHPRDRGTRSHQSGAHALSETGVIFCDEWLFKKFLMYGSKHLFHSIMRSCLTATIHFNIITSRTILRYFIGYILYYIFIINMHYENVSSSPMVDDYNRMTCTVVNRISLHHITNNKKNNNYITKLVLEERTNSDVVQNVVAVYCTTSVQHLHVYTHNYIFSLLSPSLLYHISTAHYIYNTIFFNLFVKNKLWMKKSMKDTNKFLDRFGGRFPVQPVEPADPIQFRQHWYIYFDEDKTISIQIKLRCGPFLCASDAVIQMKPGLVFLSSTLPSLTLQSSVTRLTLRPATSYLPHRRYFFFPKRTPCQRKSLCSEPNSTTFAASASLSSMSSAFHPEKARVPPAMQTPTPPITKFMIGLLQLKVTADKESNIVHARKAVEAAVKNGAKLVVLPEIWNSPYSNDSFPVYAEDIDAGFDASPSTAMLSEVAQLLNITIIGGSIPERNGDKLYNTCCVYGPDGKLKAKHRKIHLFDIDIPGKITFKESQTLTAGETPTVVDTEVGRIGIGICYDIRFQELAMLYAARGAQLICYPGAFNMTTGPLHWELLQRAR